jgi:two-component system phosphate regulon sensor histidine kinase PhoR
MAQASFRTPFFRTAIIWSTIGAIALVVMFVALVNVTAPQAAVSMGLMRFFVLCVGLLLLGYGLHARHVRSLERSLIHPLQRVTDVTQAIVEGAVSGRIELGPHATDEVVSVAEAVNRLAQKATRDIAEMKRLERVRSEFVGNVSHELRTPIFSVQGYLETLLDGAIDDPEVSRQFLEKAYQNALRLNALLSDLIDISRIESGELRMSFRYFDIGDLMRDVTHTMEHRGSQRGITLQLDVMPGVELSVYGDKERLTQVLTNLIDNAIKYNVDGGFVVLSARRHKGKVTVRVADTGIGITEDHKSRIFERFYRVDKDRSRAVGGTGLGLAIVKHILEAHAAPIEVSSEPGKGTTISFTLKGL